MYNRLVVPLDGSDIAEVAIAHAEAMASLIGVPIHLVRVVNVADLLTTDGMGMMPDARLTSTLLADEGEAAMQYLESVSSRMVKQGFQVTHDIRFGQVVEQIIGHSQPGDLLAMASHGRSGLKRWFLGSVAEDVIRRSDVPVLIIRALSSDQRSHDRAPLHAGSTV